MRLLLLCGLVMSLATPALSWQATPEPPNYAPTVAAEVAMDGEPMWRWSQVVDDPEVYVDLVLEGQSGCALLVKRETLSLTAGVTRLVILRGDGVVDWRVETRGADGVRVLGQTIPRMEKGAIHSTSEESVSFSVLERMRVQVALFDLMRDTEVSVGVWCDGHVDVGGELVSHDAAAGVLASTESDTSISLLGAEAARRAVARHTFPSGEVSPTGEFLFGHMGATSASVRVASDTGAQAAEIASVSGVGLLALPAAGPAEMSFDVLSESPVWWAALPARP